MLPKFATVRTVSSINRCFKLLALGLVCCASIAASYKRVMNFYFPEEEVGSFKMEASFSKHMS